MTRSEGVNTDGGEKRLVGVKMILHILCSAERCMIRKSSSLSFTLAFSPFIFSFAHPPCPFFGRHHSEGVLLRHPVNGLTLNSWSCTLILAIIRGCKRKRQKSPFISQVSWTICVRARRFRLEIMDLDAKLEFFVFVCMESKESTQRTESSSPFISQ